MFNTLYLGDNYEFVALMQLSGILIGHLYYFLMFKYPQDFGGPSLLSTPEFLLRCFPNRRIAISGYGQAPAREEINGGVSSFNLAA